MKLPLKILIGTVAVLIAAAMLGSMAYLFYAIFGRTEALWNAPVWELLIQFSPWVLGNWLILATLDHIFKTLAK